MHFPWISPILWITAQTPQVIASLYTMPTTVQLWGQTLTHAICSKQTVLILLTSFIRHLESQSVVLAPGHILTAMLPLRLFLSHQWWICTNRNSPSADITHDTKVSCGDVTQPTLQHFSGNTSAAVVWMKRQRRLLVFLPLTACLMTEKHCTS